jgi:hypothetical protein
MAPARRGVPAEDQGQTPRPPAPGRGSGAAVGEDETAFSYRDNYERLVHAKDKYDSSSLFRINQNIKPAE